MSTKHFKYVILWSLFLSIISSCNKDDSNETDPADELDTFEKVIAQAEEFEEFPETRETEVLEESEPENDDILVEDESGVTTEQRFVCTTKTVSVLDGNGQFPLFNTNADVIYPGSLLQGKTLDEATPSPIVVERAGGTISYDLNNGNLQSSFTVDEVRKSTIQDAMNNIIANSGDVVPANFQLDIIQVESESQLALELGLDFKGFGAKVSTDFSFSTDRSYNRTLVKLNQTYYTMSFDLPTSVDDIFAEGVTPEDLNNFIQPDNPATFISSVTFGRIFYMLIESTSSRQEMQANVNAGFSRFGVSANAEVETSSIQSLENLKIKVIAYGGDAEGAFELAGETSIDAIANRLAQSTDVRAGLPLSYVVRSVERPDQIVGTTLATEYDIIECELKGTLPKAAYRNLVDVFEEGIGAAAQISFSTIVVFNKPGTEYILYSASAGEVLGDKYSITDANGPFGGTQLSEIGAAFKATVLDDGKQVIYLFNGSGLQIQAFKFDQLEDLINIPEGPIGTYDEDVLFTNNFFTQNGTFPFPGDGIEAGLRFIANGLVNGENARRSLIFSSGGSEFSQVKLLGEEAYNPDLAKQSTNEYPGTPGSLFDRVGAASRVVFSNGNNIQLLFINDAGDQMMYWEGDINGTTTNDFLLTDSKLEGTFSGPFVLN